MIRNIAVTRWLSLKSRAWFITAEKMSRIASYSLPKDKKFLDTIAEYEQWLDPNIKFDVSKWDSKELLKGYATEHGTEKYASRGTGKVSKLNFRYPYQSKLKLSSLGIGTYMGAPDCSTDFAMYNSVKESVLSGAINVIDTGLFFVFIATLIHNSYKLPLYEVRADYWKGCPNFNP